MYDAQLQERTFAVTAQATWTRSCPGGQGHSGDLLSQGSPLAASLDEAFGMLRGEPLGALACSQICFQRASRCVSQGYEGVLGQHLREVKKEFHRLCVA